MMKRFSVLLLFLLPLWLLLSINTNAQTKSADSKTVSLISSIIRKYPQSTGYYLLIEIGKTQYLIKGSSAKILKTKKFSKRDGGMCGIYAMVRMFASDSRMRMLSEGEGGIWQFDGKNWREIATTEANGWVCDEVKNILAKVRKCLGTDDCS